MLLGHVGAALAARPAARKAPLGVLLVAGEGLDRLCVGSVAAGVIGLLDCLAHAADLPSAIDRSPVGIAIDRRSRR